MKQHTLAIASANSSSCFAAQCASQEFLLNILIVSLSEQSAFDHWTMYTWLAANLWRLSITCKGSWLSLTAATRRNHQNKLVLWNLDHSQLNPTIFKIYWFNLWYILEESHNSRPTDWLLLDQNQSRIMDGLVWLKQQNNILSLQHSMLGQADPWYEVQESPDHHQL